MEQKKDYKSYLSKTAKQMILIHDPNLLSRLVIRTLTRNLGIKHAGLFLYNKFSQRYSPWLPDRSRVNSPWKKFPQF